MLGIHAFSIGILVLHMVHVMHYRKIVLKVKFLKTIHYIFYRNNSCHIFIMQLPINVRIFGNTVLEPPCHKADNTIMHITCNKIA